MSEQITDIPQELWRLGEVIRIHRIALREVITDSDKQEIEETIKRLEGQYADLVSQKVENPYLIKCRYITRRIQ